MYLKLKRGAISKTTLKKIGKKQWDLNNLFVSELVGFKIKDKKSMQYAFDLWLNGCENMYGKKDYVEVLIFTRKEK